MSIIEDYPERNLYYHTPNDTLDTRNLEFYYEVIRSLGAGIVSLSGVLENDGYDIPNNEDNCS